MIYLDTSALLKLYIREEGSEFVQAQVMSQDYPLPVWDLQQAELIDVLRLKTFWDDIDKEQADHLIALFDERMKPASISIPRLTETDL